MDARNSLRLVAAGLLFVSLAAAQTSRRRSAAHVENDRLTVSYSPSDLEPNAAAAFLTLADAGLTHIESVLKLKYSGERIQFRVSRRVRISNAYGSRINLPLTRVQQRSAPYLHETTHILMQQYSRGYQPPTWLNEGFASYMESYIADELGGYDAHVFTRDGNRSVDAEAREHLETSYGREAEPLHRSVRRAVRNGSRPGACCAALLRAVAIVRKVSGVRGWSRLRQKHASWRGSFRETTASADRRMESGMATIVEAVIA